MNTQQNSTSDHGHAAAMQTLFPGGVAALDASTVRALLTDYTDARARYTGPVESPTARAGAMIGTSMGAPYEIRAGGVARIELQGLMLQRPGFLARLFLSAVDTVEVAAAVEAAAQDASVRSILLMINSPGGAVHGTAELAAALASAARTKPVVALTEGNMCSAAYWAASSCSNIYGSSPSVMVGSIGVVWAHTYAPSASGAVVTEVASGKYKKVGSSSKPLSGDDLAHLQEKVDYMATQFINAVAASRSLTPASVAAQEARVYIGQQAIDAGLLDGFMSAGELESQLAADPRRFMKRTRPQGRPAVSAPGATAPTFNASATSSTSAPPLAVATIATSAQVVPQATATATAKSLEDVRLEAAEMARVHWLTSREPVRVMSFAQWHAVGQARAKKDGCTSLQGMRREGYIHSYINESDPRPLHTPGATSTMTLTKKQQAERGLAWSRARNISIVEAFKQLGVG